ncbi:MAG: AMP-binding protein [Acidimicrobiales bacterium]
MTTAVEVAKTIDAAVAGQTIQQRYLATLAAYPDTEVVRWKNADGEWESWTNTQLAEVTARLVTSLKGMGVGPGDRVVLMLLNRAEFHALDLAVLCCGATPVSIYNSSAPEQVDYLVNHCKGKVAILENAALYQRFASVRDKLATLENIVVIDEVSDCGPDVLSYASMLESEPADLSATANASTAADLATVIYTSGTTGVPKGVMLTHSNVCWTLESMLIGLGEQTDIGDPAGLRYVSYLPMAHVMERLLGHYLMLATGTQVICCPDTRQVAAYAGETHPHMFIGVPRVWEKLYAGVNAALSADPERAGKFNEAVAAAIPLMERMTDGTATQEDIDTWNFFDAVAFTTVRGLIGLDETVWAVSGAAPVPPEILSWFRAIGVPLTEGYGMSETTAILTWSNAAKSGYVGRPMPGVEMRLGEDNEVLARGGNMFTGYLDAPDKTAETIDEDNWVHTGDIGEIDDDGYLKIVDRKKELIITAGGKNISPANLEAALQNDPPGWSGVCHRRPAPIRVGPGCARPRCVWPVGRGPRPQWRRCHAGSHCQKPRGHRRDRSRCCRGHVRVQQRRGGQEGGDSRF